MKNIRQKKQTLLWDKVALLVTVVMMTGVLTASPTEAANNVFPVNGNVGAGTTSPAAMIESLALTEQLRLSYNPLTYASFTVDLAGDLTIKPASTNGVRFQPTANSTDFFQVLDAQGNPLLHVDAINKRVFVGTDTPAGTENFSVFNSTFSTMRARTPSVIVTFAAIESWGGARGALGTDTNHDLGFFTNNSEKMRINTIGNVGIGTTNPQTKLAVNGTITAREIVVEPTGWPDFVFKKDYLLMPLRELEASIKEKGHLPGIPLAEKAFENGVSLGQMQAKLLQKVEELTLYVIKLEKEVQSLKRN